MPDNEREKLTRIFRYLKELDELRNPAIRSLKGHPLQLALDDLPAHPAILQNSDEESVLIHVTKPAVSCPAPPESIAAWLKAGWQDVDGVVELHEEQQSEQAGGVVNRIFFQDDPQRPVAHQEWTEKRAAWAKAELAARQVYEQLEQAHSELEKEGEEVVVLIGTAFLEIPEEKVSHPLLLQGAALTFRSQEPAYIISLLDEPPVVYQPLLRSLPALDRTQMDAISAELRTASPDLTDREQTKSLVARLALATGHPLKAGEVLILQRRTLGHSLALDRVLQDLEAGTPVTGALRRIVGLEQVEEPAANVPADQSGILLSKPANEEQLRIARRLEQSDAVLVQGPPGTGKTHTIANLLGHFLAHGKSVLVTAHTSKALRVVRDMVAEPLRPLCLTVLDNDTENRDQLNHAVQAITARLSESDAEALSKESAALETRRAAILQELVKLRASLFEARHAEAQPIIAAGQSFTPIEAARLMKEGEGRHDWIPGRIDRAADAPLNLIEASFLYESNATLDPADEKALETSLPDPQHLVSTSELAMLMAEQARLSASAGQDRAEWWTEVDPPLSIARLEAIQPRITAAANTIRSASGWWLEVVRAGRQGGVTRQIWEELAEQIESLCAQGDALQPGLMKHAPEIQTRRIEDEPDGDDVTLLSAICDHLRAGSALGMWTKATRRPWHRLADRCKVSGKVPTTLEEFEVLLALARLNAGREALRARWQRQVLPAGGPDASTLGLQPEKAALPIVQDIRARLNWHGDEWQPLQRDLVALGFEWETYASGIVMERNEFGDLARFRQAVSGGLPGVIRSRRDALRLAEVHAVLDGHQTKLKETAESPLTQRLLTAIAERDALAYSEAGRDVSRLTALRSAAAKRRELLSHLEKAAPDWALQIRARTAPHDAKIPPGDVVAAWRWKQISDDLTQRAQTDLQDLQTRIERLNADLLEVTSLLVENRAWAAKKTQIGLKQQAALEGYAGCLQKMTKSGRGKRDAALMAAAREHLKTARSAVPVWIMPLSRVYESFYSEETLTRFDIVIIDEASQSDVSALAALYLGAKAIIVGDEEQVTPTPFADLERVQQMISTSLSGIPNRELYDPETSVYHLARAFFKERIFLREHFRSVPEIIQFSNELSYDGHIRPLREASSSPLKPSLIAHHVKGSVSSKKINEEEAEEVVALLMACLEQPEYEFNHHGEPCSFGVISLLGDEQAGHIEHLLRARLSPLEFEKRRIVCGNASQFQGDERDVMFLSMVDAGEGTAQPLRGFGPREIFRKRFNVAASRARNQMWVVHSLDPAVDLQPGDLRRRLIDYCQHPTALKPSTSLPPRSTTTQLAVQTWLEERGYSVSPNWPVGAFRVSLAVRQGSKHLAIECDGDRERSAAELTHEMEKEATLERLGWPFARVRASLCHREPEAALQPLIVVLDRLGITPKSEASEQTSPDDASLLARVQSRAPQIRWAWEQRTKPGKPAVPAPVPPPAPASSNGTEPASATTTVVVEVGDWVEFILSEAPKDRQYVSIVSGPTDVDLGTISETESLAKALLGLAAHGKGSLVLGDSTRELEVLQIHKPRKSPAK